MPFAQASARIAAPLHDSNLVCTCLSRFCGFFLLYPRGGPAAVEVTQPCRAVLSPVRMGALGPPPLLQGPPLEKLTRAAASRPVPSLSCLPLRRRSKRTTATAFGRRRRSGRRCAATWRRPRRACAPCARAARARALCLCCRGDERVGCGCVFRMSSFLILRCVCRCLLGCAGTRRGRGWRRPCSGPRLLTSRSRTRSGARRAQDPRSCSLTSFVLYSSR